MTKTKSIVVTVIALLVLSMFSSIALAGTGKTRRMLEDSSTESGIPSVVDALPVVEDKSRSYSIGEINSCLDAKLKRGDRASFVFEDNEYSIRQGLVGDRYTQLSLQGLSDRFYSGDAKKYDFDADGNDDVQVAVYDLLNGNAYLSVCGLEDKQSQDESVEVSDVAEQESQDEVLDLADNSEEKATYSLFGRIVNWFN